MIIGRIAHHVVQAVHLLCALCGGWAAFLAWGLVQGLGVGDIDSAVVRVILIGGILALWWPGQLV